MSAISTLRRNAPLLSGLPFAAAWVALTALTGATYHLAPLLAAAAPGVVLAQLAALPRAAVARAMAAGAVSSALAWAAVVAASIEPTATLVHRQPGGVPVEVLLATAVGALTGGVLVRRRLVRLGGTRRRSPSI